MPCSTRSNWSRQSSPAQSTGSARFNPFLILDEPHKNHRPTDITELDGRQKIFCRKCLDLRSLDDIKEMNLQDYRKYIIDLFELLERYTETLDLRRIVLALLGKFLPERPFAIHEDHQVHRILRVLYKLLKNSLYEKSEFLPIVRVMSGLSIEFLKPIPLRSIWEIWNCLLERGQEVSTARLVDHTNEDISRHHMGQAAIIRSYLALCNNINRNWISEIYFSPNRKTFLCEYFDESQLKCLNFAKDLLIPNCECYLDRDTALNSLGLIVISEMFGALIECFSNAVKRKDDKFLQWMQHKDILALANRIFARNSNAHHRPDIDNFIKIYVKYYLEAEYGKSRELDGYIREDIKIETVANRIDALVGDAKRDACIFYIMINWVAIKQKSRYFVASRVKSLFARNPSNLDSISEKVKNSILLMRIFGFVSASSFINQTNHNRVILFFENSWREMLRDRTLSRFRSIYCHEPFVFNWAYKNEYFIELINCEAISYLVERGVAQDSLVNTLSNLLAYPKLRDVFHRYIKRNANDFFKTIIPMGPKAMNGKIINDFASWLPALFHETILRYKNSPRQTTHFCHRLTNLLKGLNHLVADTQKTKFYPHLDEQSIIDFTNLLEQLYKGLPVIAGSDSNLPIEDGIEVEFLIAANEFVALLMRSNNPCVMNLIKYIDFTLIGYMYHILDNYKAGDRLGEAIAELLVAYMDLDYPIKHRIEENLYPMVSNAYEWMMSKNSNLHAISVIMVEKLYTLVSPSQNGPSQVSHENLSNSAKVCIVTGFMHMVCSHIELLQNQVTKAPILKILEHEDFKYHVFYHILQESLPNPREAGLHHDESDRSSSSSDMSFASVDTGEFEEEQISVTRILEQLNDDEGYRSASVINLPRNTYLNRIMEDQEPEEILGSASWEQGVYTQASSSGLQTRRN